MCGTVGKSPHNQVLGEVVSDHQVIHLVPIEQICAQSVPCMRRHITHISNWFGCPGTCLTNSTFFPLSLWISLEMPCQNTESLALSMHFSIPKCPSCICSNTFLISVEGMRSLAPFVISSILHWQVFSVVPKQCEVLVEASYDQLAIPYECNAFKSVSVGSLDVSSWISSISVELTGRLDVMRLTATIGSWIPSSSTESGWLCLEHQPVEFPCLSCTGHQMVGMGSSSQSIFVSWAKSPPCAFYIWRLVASGWSPEWTVCHRESNEISPFPRLSLSFPSPGFGNSFHFQSRPLTRTWLVWNPVEWLLQDLSWRHQFAEWLHF